MSTPARTERDLDRLVDCSDATVAIAITLLIQPLADLAGEVHGGAGAGELLRDHRGSIVEFVVRFWVISRFWRLGHQVFEHVQSDSPLVLRLNFVWLISIASLPFAANLLDTTDTGRAAHAVDLSTIIGRACRAPRSSSRCVAPLSCCRHRSPRGTRGSSPRGSSRRPSCWPCSSPTSGCSKFCSYCCRGRSAGCRIGGRRRGCAPTLAAVASTAKEGQ
ncbi:TMEM175 family protein [Curtobacterium luteum]|uniref:TMEM175 family protein n=1 Tax=Curtobacterium luteum TaxID=33881 RepID=UPI0009F91592